MTASTHRFVYFSEFSSVDGEPLFKFVEYNRLSELPFQNIPKILEESEFNVIVLLRIFYDLRVIGRPFSQPKPAFT
jgi:predicted transcriptional regulator